MKLTKLQDFKNNSLIKDADSGFNDIQGEIEEEPLDFETEFEGGSSNEQDPFSEDAEEWNESDHPRNEQGEFTNGVNSSSSGKKPSERHNRVKSRERNPLNMSETEKAVLRDAVARNLFNDEEKENGFAVRNTSQYSYLIKIDNAELLSYTPISRSKIK